ncbi:hypothetical protein BaRGS_00028677, partial [Batillaria attramentaria]
PLGHARSSSALAVDCPEQFVRPVVQCKNTTPSRGLAHQLRRCAGVWRLEPARYPENVLEYDASPENDSDRAAEVLVPNEADFLLAYSTVPGFVSVRHKTEGSWYIRPLTKLLNEHAHCRDLVDILTMVNREVGKMYTADGFRQAPAMMSMLRKKVIFEEHFRLLLFGKTGAGKSSTGNTILSAKLFGCNSIFSGCTKTCELRRGNIGHHTLEVMDSPGLYDKDKENEVITTAIVQAVAGMHPGPHAILYVVQVGRYLDQEYGAYRHLKALFDEGITKYIIVLFTHGDRLQFGQTVEDALRQSPNKELSQVLDECNNRHVIFNNNANDPRPQVEKLMEMVRQLNRENKRPYKCPKYMSIGENLEKEVAVRLEKVEEEETRKLKVVQKLQTEKKAAEEGLQKAQQVMKKMQLEHERQMQEEQEKREAAKRLMEGTPAGAQLNDEAQGEEEKAPGQHLERKTEAIAKLEEEIEQEKQILEAKEKECAELEARQREEELRETERRRERYEKEVNILKHRIAEMKEKAFIDKARSECAMITEKIAH